jgi:hypothetical protein
MPMDFVIAGSPRVRTALQDLLDNTQDWDALGPQVHDFLIQKQIALFASEGSSEGVAWPKYAGNDWIYGIFKRAILGPTYGKRLLRWEPGRERLFSSLVSSKHPEHIWQVEKQKFTFGTSVPYAYKHQKGVGRGPFGERIPKREMAVLSTQSIVELKQIILTFIGLTPR